jgi:DNA invertase Pin-like site-specific DNA recombinase
LFPLCPWDERQGFRQTGKDGIKQRQLEGITLAKKRGAYKGRKPSLTQVQADQLRSRAKAGEPKSKLAREYGISRETLYAYLRVGSSDQQ